MPAVKIVGFDGLVPRQSATLLADNQAQQADNVKLYSRELRYWRGSSLMFTPAITGLQSIYKYYGASTTYWLTWQTDVNVVQSPTTDTSDYRLYYTGDGVPKKTNESLVSTGSGAYPRGWLKMGVPTPTTAPSVAGGATYRTCTITIAAPGVVTLAAHGLQLGDQVRFATTGALPTGLAAGTNYYVVSVTTDTFQVSSTYGGDPITTSGTQSGTQSVATSTNAESRVYVYTYVSTFGSLQEESAPSPASTILTVYGGAAVTVGTFATAPTTNYNITSRRIYRSVTGATTDNYEFVAEIPLATTSYSDTKTSAQLGSVLPTVGWTTPPDDLKGLVALPSGALAGFSGNTVYFSQPFYPHAWPISYAINIPFKVVGLGVYGSSVVVMTERYPHIINGGIPGAMSVERVPMLEPCVSKKSIVSNADGILYASPNGLVSIGYSNRSVVTNNLFRRDEWQKYTPTFIQAASYDGKYVALYATSSTSSFVLSPDDTPALSKISVQADAVHVDSVTGELYYCATADSKIYQADADDLNPLTYTWKSKRFQLPQPTTFSALRVDADYSQASTATAYLTKLAQYKARNASLFGSNLLGTLNSAPLNYSYYDSDSLFSTAPYRGITVGGSILVDLPQGASARSVQVQLYGDGDLKTTLNLTSFDTIRVPSFKSRDLEVVVRGTINVRSVVLATTVPEVHQ